MPDAAIQPEIEIDPFFAADLRQMQQAKNYQRWQMRLLAPYLGPSVLEVGGGIGTFTCELARRAASVVSLEPNAYCFAQLQERTRKLPNVQALDIPVETLSTALPSDWRADAVVCMNVLEHIRDDVAALRVFSGRLRRSGCVIITVPAGAWAYGEIDRRLGHYRRYDKRTLRSAFEQAGLQIRQLRYFNSIGIWAWWWNAKCGGLRAQSDFQIKVFDRGIVPWLSRIEGILPPPVGQSLLAVGELPPD
jgi:SAM-dependent methyltransferase